MPENTSGWAGEPEDRGVVVSDVDVDPAPEHAPDDASESPAEVAIPRERATQPEHRVNLPKPSKGPDKFFSALTMVAGFLIVALVAFVAYFLISMSIPALRQNQANFLLSKEWSVSDSNFAFGIAKVLWTTVYISLIALVIAVPIAIGVALLITQYLSPRLGNILGFLIDLLAAVPSVIYGLWGLKVFGQTMLPVYNWLGEHASWIPFFKPEIRSAGNLATASLVLAIMILPIITALSRDVFAQTPRDHKEAALALGATKWEVIRTTVLPYGRSGVVAASMLGLGRALGETVAVMIILSVTTSDKISVSLLQGGETFASKIATASGEFDSARKAGAYIAAGLVLFVVTFVVNALARVVAERGKAKS